jgi:glucose/arabinose dehydrogenase
MKKTITGILVGIIIIVAVIAGYMYWKKTQSNEVSVQSDSLSTSTDSAAAVNSNQTASSTQKKNTNVEVFAKDLTIPWDFAFLPEGGMLVTERPGQLVYLKPDGSRQSIIIDNVKTTGESGLLGITLHPDFAQNRMLYIYVDHAKGSRLVSEVERYVYKNGALSDKKTIISNIPGALYHDGGRMEFGPDGKLYITTGDATTEQIAQDKNSLGGKILRINDDGSIPNDNPFGTAVYSYGHRNPQGLAWDIEGNLWETEHGRSGVLTGMDEINLITPGANYGWPTIEGSKTKAGMVTPVLNSGATVTWAPASLLFWDGSLFYGGLKGEGLYEAKLDGTKVASLKKYFAKEYGRIRTVQIGPDGMFYFTTSNKDGRGTIQAGDDKILRVNPARFRQ